jgi:hypothetical protein
MATIPFALSISHLVSSAGADVGFAAILGLAILVLLFFSQARETATLRRRADEAEQQLRDLAAYVDQLLRRPAGQPTQAPATGTVAPVPPPAAARVAAREGAYPAARPAVASSPAAAATAAAAGAVATIPAAPAGMGAPALSSATRLIPLADPISIRALKSGNGNGTVAPEPEADSTATATAPAPAAPVGPPPSTPAGGANGSNHTATPAPAPAPDVSSARREPPAGDRPIGPPTFNDPVPPGRTRVSRLALVVASIVAVVIVIVAVLVLLNRGSSSGTPASASNRASNASSAQSAGNNRHHAAPVVTPSAVTVAVLNGTTTSHLAADVMGKLTSAGYKPGAKTNAPEQNLTSTIVGYAQPGSRADALAVAKSLNLKPAAVRPVSTSDLGVACHGATTGCTTNVVVTLGSDLSSTASTGGTATTP